jgi:REP element-mobilizing transposase RayT
LDSRPAARVRRYDLWVITGRRFYRRNLPHFQSDFRSYYVTFVTEGRLVLPPIARDIVLQHIVFDHGRRMWLEVAVVMPDHAHLILTPSNDPTGWSYALAEILKGIKGCSSRNVNRVLGRLGTLWQHESFDHELRNDESVREKAEYICQNPVRWGLVKNVDDYPWLWREWVEGLKT